MTSPRYPMRSLAALQAGRYLAELESDDGALVVTLAGPPGVVMLELANVTALAVAYESLDPQVRPSELRVDRALPTDALEHWEPDDALEARVVEVFDDGVDDVLVASSVTWKLGDRSSLLAAPCRFALKVESWTLAPGRSDLHVLVGCHALTVHDENGEVALAPDPPGETSASERRDATAPAPHDPFRLGPNDVPAELLVPLRTFFIAHHAGDWPALAAVHPAPDAGGMTQADWLSRHFLDLWDFGYARAIDGWWREGDLACVVVRGIHASPADGEMEALTEECVWAFSLRRREGGWIIRHWSQGWPNHGSAEPLAPRLKPWLDEWR